MLSLKRAGIQVSACIQEAAKETEKGLTRRSLVASFHSDHEKFRGENIPSLHDMESGKLVGAVLPMSEQAQMQMQNSIEVIDYLLNQERVVWS
jgi:hypothetical protein